MSFAAAMRRVVAIVVAALVLLAPARVLAEEEETPEETACQRPKLTLLRYDEDFSFLRDPRCRTDVWDPLKYVALHRRFPIVLSLGLDVRERLEYFDALDWGRDPSGDAGFLIQRVMPHADLHIGPHVQVFFMLTSNVVWGHDARPLDRDDLDVLQAFGSVSLGSFSVRAGRQEIQYASSRLVSVREGPNVRLAFDGLRVMQRVRTWQVDGFALVPVRVRPGVFDDRPAPGEWFWGIYATGPVLAERIGLDVYYLGRLRQTAPFEQGTDRELRHTAGARLWGEPGGWDYNIEAAYQTGSFGPGTIAAWMLASDVGYTFDALPAMPRLGAQANVASGDRSPRSAGLQTFNPLFPRGLYFSQANLIGPLNTIDLHPALTLRPVNELAITVDWDFFWRQSLADGLYLPSTVLQVPGTGNPARYVGSQGAVLVQWQATRHAAIGASYSHFFTGPFLQLAGAGHDVDFIGAWVSYAI